MHGILCVLILALVSSQVLPSTSAQTVTNDQLRDGILSLVHSYTTLENKLDRHEQRERALGDVIKRGLQTLQKGQKIFEPMRGTFARLDERMSQMETLLMAQDEKFTDQQNKVSKALEMIMKWMVDKDNLAQTEPPKKTAVVEVISNGFNDEDEGLAKKMEDLSDNVKRLRLEIGEMVADKEQTSKGLIAQTEKLVNSKLASADDVIARLEDKLANFYITGPASTPQPPQVRSTEWENNITSTLLEIQSNVVGLKENSATASPLAGLDKEFFVTMANETLEAIEDMRIEVLSASDKSFAKTSTRIKEATGTLDGSINEILKTIADSSSTTEELFDGVSKSYKDLKSDVAALAKLEKILLETGDNVLSVKRGMEFNVHAVTLEIGDIVKASGKEINSTLHKRFDALNQTIWSNHIGALSNLTSKIETEMSQVWRQIGIMNQVVSSSKLALNRLQEQTEAYVNGTFTTMDSMEGKVAQITGRMAEVDSNLNYLLGRLSLVTQEFNQIKTGLGSALDDIKSSFQSVQSKIQNVGPGPHKIKPEENETDYNLSRDARAAA